MIVLSENPRASSLMPHAYLVNGYVKQLTRLAKAYANAEADVIAAQVDERGGQEAAQADGPSTLA